MYRERPRILLVEDDEFAAALLARIFANYGCDTITFRTLAQSMSSLDIPIDALVLDLVLPDGDGVTLFKALRLRNLPAKVVVWTAYPFHDRQDLMELKPDLLLSKPTSFDALETFAQELSREFVPRRPSDGG